MNPQVIDGPEAHLAYKDAVFVSPHKFVGGVGASGLLIAKKKLFPRGIAPSVPGGGTVFFVTDKDHSYIKDIEEKEQGGTPNIIGTIRAGLVFQLKATVGEAVIREREHELFRCAMDRWKSNTNIVVLGNTDVERIAIVSFMVRHGQRFLHYNYVGVLLNDLFGIQSRGGCACAGPYGQSILGVDHTTAKCFESQLLQDNDNEFLRPGFVRINFNYFTDDATRNFIIEAVDFVATHGWKFLPYYTFYTDTGEWVHIRNKRFPARKWLHDISFAKEGAVYPTTKDQVASTEVYVSYMEEAQQLAGSVLEDIKKGFKTIQDKAKIDQQKLLAPEGEAMRWFVYPAEILQQIGVPGAAEVLSNSVAECKIRPNNDAKGTIAIRDQGDSTFLGRSFSALLASRLSEKPAPGNDETHVPMTATVNPINNKTQNALVLEAQRTAEAIAAIIKEEKKLEEEDDDAVCMLRPRAQKPAVPSVSSVPTPEAEAVDTSKMTPKQLYRMRQKSGLLPKIPDKEILRPTMRAIKEFDMIRGGDRVLLGLSGGKDSLTLLHTLLAIKRILPPHLQFELGACTVDPQTDAYDPSPLIPYMAKLGVPYFFESQPIIDIAKDKGASSICSWCARMKRGVLYGCARREGYNVLALGQHLDDLAESFVMSVFNNGLLRTIKAHYSNDKGDLRVIRPFVFVREKMFREFAEKTRLPVINENCPACFTIPKERRRVKTLLAAQEHVNPNLFSCLLRAMHPLMTTNMRNLVDALAATEDPEDVVEKENGDQESTATSATTSTTISKKRQHRVTANGGGEAKGANDDNNRNSKNNNNSNDNEDDDEGNIAIARRVAKKRRTAPESVVPARAANAGSCAAVAVAVDQAASAEQPPQPEEEEETK
eukprot:TRINITY_DN1790_c1_g1_i16.p1 TRINITY_DN1790_c1_g1~~TRINITY_DN1790_c1_g1_i16.p1  ORF type:complete len:881 (-),score=187.71 TRINITY_DN1790_c1_g1_i16:2093-4735(-)